LIEQSYFTEQNYSIPVQGNPLKNDNTITDKYGRPLHPDAQLVQACLRGDSASQRLLYEQYRRPMFRICLRYGSSRQDAEDFLQEGFVRVFKDLRQYRMEGPLGAWIRKVVLNSILQHLRKRRLVFSGAELSDLEGLHAADEDIPGNLDAEILTRYIQALPDGYRTVFNMFVIEGYTHQEIAEELAITVGTSKSQLSKARGMLRSWLTHIHSPENI
jgi:RNA polymerase sigma-70 factor (ECF subfamily)